MGSQFAGILNKLQNPFPSILNQLEQLSRQENFSTSRDDANVETLGTLTASRRNSKPFIIGFIPPNNPINFTPIASTKQQITKINRTMSASSSSFGGISNDQPNKTEADLPEDFFFALQALCQRIRCRPEDLMAVMHFEASGHGQHLVSDSVAINFQGPHKGQPVAKGLIQFTLSGIHAAGMSRDTWDTLEKTGPTSQLVYVENYLNSVSGGRPYNSLSSLYLAVFAGRYIADPDSNPNRELFAQGSAAALSNPAFSSGGSSNVTVGSVTPVIKSVPRSLAFKAAVKRYNDVVSGTAPEPTLTPSLSQTDDGIQSGLMTFNSTDIAEDPLSDPMGRNITVASAERQKLVAKQTTALQNQINLIQNIPPLILLINPSEFTRSFEWNVDNSPTTRTGHIVHMWLEKPMSISGHGVTAGQYVVNADGNGGLTNFYRVHSLSYQNLLSLLSIYKNNGVLYSSGDTSSEAGIPIIAMSLYIYYDNHIYIGSFDDLGIDDSGDKPYNMDYNFKFTVRYDLELDTINQNLDSVLVSSLGF